MCSKIMNKTLIFLIIFALLVYFIPTATTQSHELSQIKSENINVLSHVDPYSYYSKEPAPMGIADYGLGENEVPYTYNSSSFEGSINIYSLNAYNGSSNEISIQLNLVMEFFNLNKEYVYWVQNAALLGTGASNSGHFIQILNNIWNASSSNAVIYNSTLSGNGTIGTSSSGSYYYDYAGSNLPGNDMVANYPLIIEFKVAAQKNEQGLPELVFEYNDGYNWIIYDNVIFNFASNLNNYNGFVVDGYNYTPYGDFFDAELVVGGAGNGVETTALQSNVTMQLEYWNGHNYQRIRNAYNFGSNTAETIGNVTAYYYPANGASYSKFTTGQGALVQLYNQSEIGTVNIITNLNAGKVNIDNLSYLFNMFEINITLVPGSYNYTIFNINNIEYAIGNFSIYAGSTLNISVQKNVYNLTFLETGLKYNSLWSVLVNNKSYYSYTDTITIPVTNGTYTYKISNVSGYKPNVYSGTVTISGTNAQINIEWTEFEYYVIFEEYGLILSIEWSVVLNNVEEYSLNSTITFLEPNGSYNFTVSPIHNYFTNTSSGKVIVSGKNLTVSIYWTMRLYNISFVEIGLKNGTRWSITLNNSTEYSNNSTIVYSVPNGTYSFSIEPIAGYKANIYGGNIRVNGSEVNYTINWKLVTYAISFVEHGLPSNTLWSIELGKIEKSSSSSMIVFIVANGTYTYKILAVTGYYPENSSGQIMVSGLNLSKSIVWEEVLYQVVFTEKGLTNGTFWSVTLNNVTENTSNISIIFSEPAGNYSYIINVPSGYHLAVNKGVLLIDSNVTVTASFSREYNLTFGYTLLVLMLLLIVFLIYLKIRNKT